MEGLTTAITFVTTQFGSVMDIITAEPILMIAPAAGVIYIGANIFKHLIHG